MCTWKNKYVKIFPLNFIQWSHFVFYLTVKLIKSVENYVYCLIDSSCIFFTFCMSFWSVCCIKALEKVFKTGLKISYSTVSRHFHILELNLLMLIICRLVSPYVHQTIGKRNPIFSYFKTCVLNQKSNNLENYLALIKEH